VLCGGCVGEPRSNRNYLMPVSTRHCTALSSVGGSSWDGRFKARVATDGLQLRLRVRAHRPAAHLV
jgi:hypothetical protein